jgi:putative DNA primase/helicase
MDAVYLPLAAGTKKPPLVAGWTADPPPPMPIGPNDNMGQRLDDAVDIDADCPETRHAAPHFLPETSRQHGRPSVGVTHWWFKAPGAAFETFVDVVQVKDEIGKSYFPTLIEIRTGKDHYTVVPPSRVPVKNNGALETLRWFAEGEPRSCEFSHLRMAVVYIATTALLARHFVADGVRWQFYEALAGFLLGNLQLRADVVRAILETAADIVKDTDTSPRPAEWVTRTEARLKKGQDCTGAPTVAEMIGEHGPAVVAQIRTWCGHTDDLILNPSDPLPSAREFVAREHTVEETLTLRHQSHVFLAYEQGEGAYIEQDEAAVRAHLYRFLEPAKRVIVDEKTEKKKNIPFQPTRSKVENVLDALRAVCNLPASMEAPCWLRNDPGLDPLDMLACPNGLLHIPKRQLHLPTPDFFTQNAIDFAYDPWARPPQQWLTFLKSLWPDDEESIGTVQELFGYLLTPDTRFQKIFLEVGPPRSGKGVKGRILRRLVGARNACSPTLAAFGRDFGKHVLIGKTVAIISDARIGGRTDTASVAETLLSISGEDAQTVERKFLPDWNGKLSTRFLLLTNELPRITDVSSALAKRFIVLALQRSFYGKEDLGLYERLVPELPGILLWALDGRDRLYARGHFQQPKSAQELIQEFVDLGSPEASFLRQRTHTEPGATVSQKDLFAEWSIWCSENGRDKPGNAQTFGRNVRAALPWITTRQLGGRGEQERYWEGLRLPARADISGLADM